MEHYWRQHLCEKNFIFGKICNLPQIAISFRILVRWLLGLQYTTYANRTLGFTNDYVDIFQRYNLTNFLGWTLKWNFSSDEIQMKERNE